MSHDKYARHFYLCDYIGKSTVSGQKAVSDIFTFLQEMQQRDFK